MTDLYADELRFGSIPPDLHGGTVTGPTFAMSSFMSSPDLSDAPDDDEDPDRDVLDPDPDPVVIPDPVLPDPDPDPVDPDA